MKHFLAMLAILPACAESFAPGLVQADGSDALADVARTGEDVVQPLVYRDVRVRWTNGDETCVSRNIKTVRARVANGAPPHDVEATAECEGTRGEALLVGVACGSRRVIVEGLDRHGVVLFRGAEDVVVTDAPTTTTGFIRLDPLPATIEASWSAGVCDGIDEVEAAYIPHATTVGEVIDRLTVACSAGRVVFVARPNDVVVVYGWALVDGRRVSRATVGPLATTPGESVKLQFVFVDCPEDGCR